MNQRTEISRRHAFRGLGAAAVVAPLAALSRSTAAASTRRPNPTSAVLQVRDRDSGAPGHEVILGRSDEVFPRHSEGDLVRLADGKLLAIWSRFKNRSDHGESEVVGRYSEDDGLSWGKIESFASISEPEHASNSNLMSASLLSLSSGGRIFFSYMGKEETEPEKEDFNRKIRSAVYARFSDDGTHFSRPRRISDHDHYYVVNNARVLQLSSGRILLPTAVALDPGEELGWIKQSCRTFYSDDQGANWKLGGACTLTPQDVPGREYRQLTLQEPGLIELKDQRILMVMRTRLNHPYKSLSEDGGESWSKPVPISEIVAPTSPQTLFRLPRSGDIAMIYNNNPKGAEAKWSERRPLAFAVSKDEGNSFRFRKVIEETEGRCWAYHSARVYGDKLYLLYYEWYQGHPTFFFTDFKLSIIPIEWFEG